jgi:hypothetical protein
MPTIISCTFTEQTLYVEDDHIMQFSMGHFVHFCLIGESFSVLHHTPELWSPLFGTIYLCYAGVDVAADMPQPSCFFHLHKTAFLKCTTLPCPTFVGG